MRQRRGLVSDKAWIKIALDAAAVALSYAVALSVRFEFVLPRPYLTNFAEVLPQPGSTHFVILK